MISVLSKKTRYKLQVEDGQAYRVWEVRKKAPHIEKK